MITWRLAVSLTEDQLRRLDEVSAISLGFPHELLGTLEMRQRLAGKKLELIDFPMVPVV